MLKGYMLICQKPKGVHRKRKVGNPCLRASQILNQNSLLIQCTNVAWRSVQEALF